MKKVLLDCECQYCKKPFKTDINKVLFFRKIICPSCENIHSVVEKENEHGTLPGFGAGIIGILCSIWFDRGTPIFYISFIVSFLVSYFFIRYYVYASKRFKVYLTKWYR